VLEEMAHHLQLTIENIFYSQESAVVLDNLYTMMKKIVFNFYHGESFTDYPDRCILIA